MPSDRLPVDLVINATIRTAAKEGVPITIVKKGDRSSGSIVLKINRLDGTAHLWSQVRMDEELVWCPLGATDPLPEPEADQLMHKQAAFDPDLWLIEIEDKQARPWFAGKRVTPLR